VVDYFSCKVSYDFDSATQLAIPVIFFSLKRLGFLLPKDLVLTN